MRASPAVDLAVRDLTARYSDAVVDFDRRAFEDCWTEDAIWEVPGVITTEGIAAISELFGSLRAGYRLCVQELLSGVVTAESETEARARWQVRELQWRDAGQAWCVIGTYRDRAVLGEDGAWRFARREFVARYRGPLDGSGRLLDPGTE